MRSSSEEGSDAAVQSKYVYGLTMSNLDVLVGLVSRIHMVVSTHFFEVVNKKVQSTARCIERMDSVKKNLPKVRVAE